MSCATKDCAEPTGTGGWRYCFNCAMSRARELMSGTRAMGPLPGSEPRTRRSRRDARGGEDASSSQSDAVT